MSVSRELYFEIMEFLTGCGKGYEALDDHTCLTFLDALNNNRCLICRDGAGKITRVFVSWLINSEDIEVVKCHGIPAELNNGTVLYVAEAAGIDGRKGLLQTLESLRRQNDDRITAYCWHNWKAGGVWKYFNARRRVYETI